MTLRRLLVLVFITAVAVAAILGLLDVWGVIKGAYNRASSRIIATSLIVAVSVGSILLVAGATFGPEKGSDDA